MRFRAAAVSVLAIASLAACSSSGGGDSDEGNSGSTGNSTSVVTNTGAAENTGAATGGAGNGSAAAFCTKLEQASTKLGDLSSAASDPDKLKDALGKIIDYFKDLDSNAPAEIEPTLSDMTDVLENAQKAVENNDPSGLSDMMSKMTTDAQKLSSYVTKNCTTG